MHQRLLLVAVAFALGGCGGPTSDGPKAPDEGPREVRPNELFKPSDFAGITDPQKRSQAIFLEASRVLMHPRCVNCHPNGDIPHQRGNMELHDPPVLRGPDNHGVVGMECTSCHQDRNQELARVPGAPHWALAPIEMAWVGKKPHDICEQMKDPKRNGGKSLAQIVEHSAHDELVGWGWKPGADRAPAPGTQEQFGALIAAWVETGAACPEQGVMP
ncbi:Isoquinoline 1-oxidoreductase subunit [Polyangium aurulentum]|uniref:Isoquinoline 1-oxidoreductase subunit n=1 Tax=Polyangium aurulentum TaxID=2567896 RepID=UPI0010ADD3D6|nr:Isoquinoline 1-oxidoreductase subunit [Polyangium aurulentum]UQA54660.1 Isoquinoline 1-oxidoreductase subunit [Polyangium aurulentum]